MNKAFRTFESFWEYVSRLLKNKQTPIYHPCCKSWTCRLPKGHTLNHTQSLQWKAFQLLSKAEETPVSDYLRAHMLENMWNPPILVNVACQLTLATPILKSPVRLDDFNPLTVLVEKGFSPRKMIQAPSSPLSMPAQLVDIPPPPRRPSQADELRAEHLPDSSSQFPSVQYTHL